jgi:hypothetical protein
LGENDVIPALTNDFVSSVSPAPDGIANAQAIVKSKKITALRIDAAGTILFAECKGSGATPYKPSADFADPEKPVFRCSCPSRQIPCKHVLALLIERVNGAPFVEAEVPEDLQAKRDKAAARSAQKEATADAPPAPKKVNLSALKKKIDAQLEGLKLLETMVCDVLRRGLANLNPSTAKELAEKSKMLGDAYLPGAQAEVRALAELFLHQATDATAENERRYATAIEQLTSLHAMCRRGSDYLKRRREDPELKPDTETSIAEWLGHAWQLTELAAAGMVETDAELLELHFRYEEDAARSAFVDIGVHLNLKSGALQQTVNYRPYKAVRHIKTENSFAPVRTIPELVIYPGQPCPRIRWAGASSRPATAADYAAVFAAAKPALGPALKEAKGLLKDPLADRRPPMLLAFKRIAKVGEAYFLEDAAGERLPLIDDPAGYFGRLEILTLVEPSLLQDQALLVILQPDLFDGVLRASPVTIVTRDRIVRLAL